MLIEVSARISSGVVVASDRYRHFWRAAEKLEAGVPGESARSVDGQVDLLANSHLYVR